MLKQYFLYNVGSRCVFNDGHIDYVWILVHAKDEFDAMAYAQEHLLSERSGYKVKDVVWQQLGGSKRFLAEDGQFSSNFPYI